MGILPATGAAVPGTAPPAAPRRILCTIDFSETSAPTVAEAVALARACRGEITVLFVIPYAPPTRREEARAPEGVTSAVAEDVEALLAPARAAGITVRVCLKAGRPAHEILETARRGAPDIIVMGTHGRGGFKRWALGSVADEVVRSAPCPVLTIACRRPGAHAASPHRDSLVCAVSLGETSSRTIAYACALGAAMGARLSFVHVAAGPGADPHAAAARLHAAATLAAAYGIPPSRVEEMVVTGVPAREIVRVAAERAAGMIVVGGQHLRGGLAGGIPDQVMRGARCAVLTVRHAEAGS